MKKSFREIAVKSIGMPGFSMAGGLSPGLENTAYFQPDQSTYSNGTHVAEVEVDIDTGAVKILRYTVLHDCGTVINPMVVEGQVVGGVAHGIGNALFERLCHDDDAQPQTTTFADYLLPGATDMPPIADPPHRNCLPAQPPRHEGRRRRRHHRIDRGHHRRGRERAFTVRREGQRSADQPRAHRRADQREPRGRSRSLTRDVNPTPVARMERSEIRDKLAMLGDGLPRISLRSIQAT